MNQGRYIFSQLCDFLPVDYLFTHESENGEYGNEQSFQYQKEGLDLEFFNTQSNYVDYLWEVLYRARNEARNGALS